MDDSTFLGAFSLFPFLGFSPRHALVFELLAYGAVRD